GCKTEKPAKAELPPPLVTVGNPILKAVTHYEYYTGRAEALESVEIRAQVSGYLKQIDFKAGSEVTKDKLLFAIDPDPYEAALATAKAAVAMADARVERLKTDFARVDKAFKDGAGSKAEFDKVAGDKLEAEAAVLGTKAKEK